MSPVFFSELAVSSRGPPAKALSWLIYMELKQRSVVSVPTRYGYSIPGASVIPCSLWKGWQTTHGNPEREGERESSWGGILPSRHLYRKNGSKAMERGLMTLGDFTKRERMKGRPFLVGCVGASSLGAEHFLSM